MYCLSSKHRPIDYSPECGLVILQPGTGSILVFETSQAYSGIDRAVPFLISGNSLGDISMARCSLY